MHRLLFFLPSARFYTQTALGLVAFLALPKPSLAQSYKSSAFYEIVAVESLPESLSLDMSLSEITKIQEKSRIGEAKKKLYDFLADKLAPVLNQFAASKDKNLLALSSKLPVRDLIADIQALRVSNPSETVSPADFMIVIFPKVPESEVSFLKRLAYSGLYSERKASVIDRNDKGFLPQKSYSQAINDKLLRSLSYIYKRQYLELKSRDPFFVGALFNVHLEGDKTWIKTQLVGGLPTGVEQEFLNENEQVSLKTAHSPSTPTLKSIQDHQDFPGAVVEFLHRPHSQNAMDLKIKFGSLGLIKNQSWQTKDELLAVESGSIGKVAGLGLDFFTNFNLPYLYGSLKAPAFIAKRYDLKINIHEAHINLNKILIDNIRVSLDLIPKKILKKSKEYVSNQDLPVLSYAPSPRKLARRKNYVAAPNLPIIELPSVSSQFTEEGNKALEPVRDKIQPFLEKTPEQILQDPRIREGVLKFILDYLKSKQSHGGVK